VDPSPTVTVVTDTGAGENGMPVTVNGPLTSKARRKNRVNTGAQSPLLDGRQSCHVPAIFSLHRRRCGQENDSTARHRIRDCCTILVVHGLDPRPARPTVIRGAGRGGPAAALRLVPGVGAGVVSAALVLTLAFFLTFACLTGTARAQGPVYAAQAPPQQALYRGGAQRDYHLGPDEVNLFVQIRDAGLHLFRRRFPVACNLPGRVGPAFEDVRNVNGLPA